MQPAPFKQNERETQGLSLLDTLRAFCKQILLREKRGIKSLLRCFKMANAYDIEQNCDLDQEEVRNLFKKSIQLERTIQKFSRAVLFQLVEAEIHQRLQF